MTRPLPARGRDRGSAVVDFVLVGSLVVVLFLGVVQIGFGLHVRNTLIDSAAEGARLAARADRGPGDGTERARELIERSVSPRYAERVSAAYAQVEGLDVVEVTVEAPLPVVGLLGPAGTVRVSAHALVEGP